jgi:hypothetical protein
MENPAEEEAPEQSVDHTERHQGGEHLEETPVEPGLDVVEEGTGADQARRKSFFDAFRPGVGRSRA